MDDSMDIIMPMSNDCVGGTEAGRLGGIGATAGVELAIAATLAPMDS